MPAGTPPLPPLTYRAPSPIDAQCYVTVYDNAVLDRDGTPFPAGRTTDNDGKTRRCVTFILLVPPKTIVHAATLTDSSSEIDSDVQDWCRHPAPDDEHPLVIGFPLGVSEGKPGPWLCTRAKRELDALAATSSG